jgi:hypothetical protein
MLNRFFSLISPSKDISAVKHDPVREEPDHNNTGRELASLPRRPPTSRISPNSPSRLPESLRSPARTASVSIPAPAPREPWNQLKIPNKFYTAKVQLEKLLTRGDTDDLESVRDNMYVIYWTSVFKQADVKAAEKPYPNRDEFLGLFADAYKKGGQDKERDVAKVRALNNNKDIQEWSKAFTRPKGGVEAMRPVGTQSVARGGGSGGAETMTWASLLVLLTATVTIMPRRL